MHHNPSSDQRTKPAFTLIELLVVISIIALLVGILLPALGSARQAAQDAECKSNVRSCGQAFHMYVNDDLGGFLPPGWTFGHPSTDNLEINEGKWNSNYLATYFGQEDQRGRWEGFGATYLRCPSQEQDCYRTYGRIYTGYDNSGAWGWSRHQWAGSATGSYGRRLEDLENNWFLVSDMHNRDWGSGDGGNRGAAIYHKTGWAYSVDWDGDGLNDSYPFVGSQGPYNAWGPWHFRAGNMLFKDGHVATSSIEEFVTNHDGVQGPGGASE